MENTFPLKERSINQIYLESQESITYMIPIYQRNYAWEEGEITELIKDVYDSFQNAKDTYYIGTLVTYNRGNGVYEVIDGQQRLTTIYIILNAVGIKEIKNRLTYGARKVSSSTIDKLGNYPNLGDNYDVDIENGYKYAEKVIKDIETQQLEGFKKYFLEKVHIIHYEVPKDVDLNHYFEVMNSRGEQLEKHEIVKSMLSQYLKKKDLSTFNCVWEACSEMSVYIQQVFNDTNLFGNNLENFKIDCFESIPRLDDSEGKCTIMQLLKKPFVRMEEEFNIEQRDKFQPIIDFPNFLLIVLKITLMKYEDFKPTEFILDDKELLNEFKKALELNKNHQEEFVRLFAFNLLKARYNLDNYIVHHSLGDKEQLGDNPWKLQFYCQKKKSGYIENLAKPKIQDELVQLLSMFEVSFTPKQRKNYLFYCMLYLFENIEPQIEEYLIFLRNLADKYFYDVYMNPACLNERKQPSPNAFDNALLLDGRMNVENIGFEDVDYKVRFEEIYEQGKADVPLFVFNYTDYKLWKKYANELRGNKTKKEAKVRSRFFEKLGCKDFGLEPFDSFYFSRTRKSLEHYYPQAKAGEGKKLSSNEINCFGNFAMIGAEANSSGSNLNPYSKVLHYTDRKYNQIGVASLKFKIMMQKCQDNYIAMHNDKLNRESGMEWNEEDIQEHQQRMLDIILQ